ncbi:MAG: hypothetical protein KIT83_22185, partial [Bryobacterales bacterium]|nr:hypothetical protein [Bryobacterales bacterium]
EMSEAQFNYFSQPAGLAKPVGLLVREVWRDTLAWDRGIRPGDLCLGLDNEPLTRLDELAVMTVPMYRPEYTLTFRRGRGDRKVVFPPGAGLTAEPEFQRPSLVTFVSPLPAIAIHLVQANSAAARAGLLPGDRLVSAGPQFAAVRPVPELFAEERNEPLFLVVERGHALHGLFLPSQPAR